MKLLHSIFNLPAKLWDSLFPPKVRHFDKLVVVSPDLTAAQGIKDNLASEHVTVNLSQRLRINNHTYILNSDEIAFVMTRKVWWKRTACVTVAIFEN